TGLRLGRGLSDVLRDVERLHSLRGRLLGPDRLLAADVLRPLVLPHAEEGRMPQPPLARPFGEAHLADQLRLEPAIPGVLRTALVEGRRLPRQRLERLRDA